MIDGAEMLYQQIADSIQEAITEQWSSAIMEAIFHPGCSTYLGEYTRAVDGVSRSFATPRNGERAFRELRKKFKEAGRPLWGRANFELQSTGKFNIKFSYDDCDENGNARFDEQEELKRAAERHKRLTSN
jgi:hypothetical protein